ncbi:MAG: rubrerythrin [Anaeroplasma sp.]
MELNGSKTEKNLLTAFTGEVQAHAKYLYFSEKAQQEGYEQIAEIFKYTAQNELEHAEIWFKKLGYLGTTKNNLKDAASGENFEWSKMYKDFSKEAEDEGFTQIARLFSLVAEIEKYHEARYNALIQNIEDNAVFNKNEQVIWECRNCGHIHIGKDAPTVCPVCSKPQAYFQIYPENFK